MSDGFYIEGWEDFTKRCEKLLAGWDKAKADLLKRMGTILLAEIKGNVPEDTSNLVDHIFLFTEGIPSDYVEVGTNVKYALYVDEGHVQHKRFLPVESISANGKKVYLKKENQRGIMLKERYVPGSHFMDKGMAAAEPRMKRIGHSFMDECMRMLEGGGKLGG